jgi:hypothetical protein
MWGKAGEGMVLHLESVTNVQPLMVARCSQDLEQRKPRRPSSAGAGFFSSGLWMVSCQEVKIRYDSGWSEGMGFSGSSLLPANRSHLPSEDVKHR